jgi:hypothetical protein
VISLQQIESSAHLKLRLGVEDRRNHLDVDPLPIPLKMNNMTKPTINSSSELIWEAPSTTRAPNAMARKLKKSPPNP